MRYRDRPNEKPIPPNEMAEGMLKCHGPIDKEGKSHALAIVRRYTKPNFTSHDGTISGVNRGASYWQSVERAMLATVGRKARRPKSEDEKRAIRARKAHQRQQAIEDKRRKRARKHAKKTRGTYDSSSPVERKRDHREEAVHR